MAESCAPLPTAGGYECDFVDGIPESLSCPVCLLPFRDPHLVSCCGAKYCELCIGCVKAAGQPCPLCKQQFNNMLDRSLQRKVLELKVRCSRKKDGCEWEGELRHLSDHEREECVLALVECGYHCGERLPRRQLAEHEQDMCPQRPVDVKLESFMRKMEERHMREMAAVREELEKMKQQMEEKEQLMEEKLAEQKDHYTSKIKEMEESLAKLNIRPLFTPPYEFILTEYSKHKRDGRNWYSPPFYSGPGGYKMCLCVITEAILVFEGSILVCIYLMRGEYDDRLVWPFRGNITVQLVDQSSDQKHQEWTFKFDDNSLVSSARSRVTSGERAISGCEKAFFSLLSSKDELNTLYVKDDCVKFRVTSV